MSYSEIFLSNLARSCGLRLEKSPERDPHGEGFGTYRIVDAFTGERRLHGPIGEYGLTLEDVGMILVGTRAGAH